MGANIKLLLITACAHDAIVHDGRLDRGIKVVFKPFFYFDVAAKILRAFDR